VAWALAREPKRPNYFRLRAKLPLFFAGGRLIAGDGRCSTWNAGGSQSAARLRAPPVVVGARRGRRALGWAPRAPTLPRVVRQAHHAL